MSTDVVNVNEKGISADVVALMLSAARAEVLDRVVFSKSHDKSVSRHTVTRRRVGGETVLQVETLRVADVARHRNGQAQARAGLS